MLRLADNSHGDEELNIDILIGADFYWHFVSGSVIRGPGSGPIALSTRLGYVLSRSVGIPVPEQETLQLTLPKPMCSKSRTLSLKRKTHL